jgi:protein-S-isoprenylcysteine O-methyltransferase Ste14
MNAAFTLVPLLLIRYGLLGLLGKTALRRAAFFPPRDGAEKAAYVLYQLATLSIFAYLFFLKLVYFSPLFYPGVALFGLGAAVIFISAVNFASPHKNGLNTGGLYRLSRNPMYVGYFLYFLGCVLLTSSWGLLIPVLVFQLSAHWIILSEERWCVKEFGEEYQSYMKKVRRYL